MNTNPPQFDASLDAVRRTEILFILAGAGLSAEVGIPTYWSDENSVYGGGKTKYGYSPLEHADASLWKHDMGAQLEYFARKRKQFASVDYASSIYGTLLHKVGDKNYFCVTSNVDSGFYRAGFAEERLYEVHGSHRGAQCLIDPSHGVFSFIDEESGSSCLVCGGPARPNVLFFNDYHFNPERLHVQQDRFNEFVGSSEQGRVVILELGVGSTVPRVRHIGDRLYRDYMTADYIHVNVEPEPEFLFGQVCSFANKERWVQTTASEFIESL